MTEALVRLSTALTTGPPPETPSVLLQGTVVALGPPIRVDSGAMQLSCVSVQAVAVGATVYVIQSGGVNLVVGTSDGATVGLITAKRIRLGQATTGVVLSLDVPMNVTTPALTAGWVEVDVSIWCGFASATENLSHALYSNTAAGPSGGAYQTPASAAISVPAANWAMMPQIRLVYPTAGGGDVLPVWRLSGSVNQNRWYDGYAAVKVYGS